MQKPSDQGIYFENMSTAFARMCDVMATVMDKNVKPSSNTFATVNQGGIWYKNEFPALRAGYGKNRVDVIEAMSVDGEFTFPYWVRKGVQATHEDNPVDKGSAEVDEIDLPGDKSDADSDITGGSLSDGTADWSDTTSTADGQSDLYADWWTDDVLSDEELMDWGDQEQ
jgi:hypothetical protein